MRYGWRLLLALLIAAPASAQDTTTLLSQFLVNLRNGSLTLTNYRVISPACDGVTNDTSIIQTAITAGGRVLIAKEGTCLTGALTIANAVILSGLSTATILKYSGSAAAYVSVSASDVTMKDLTIDPAGATVSGVTHSTGLSRLAYDNVNIIASATTANCGHFISDNYVRVSNSRWANCTDRQFSYLLGDGATATGIWLTNDVFDVGTAPVGAGTGYGAGITCTGTGNSLTEVDSSGTSYLFPNRAGALETGGIYLYCAVQGAIHGVTIRGGIIMGDTADSGGFSTSSHALEVAGVTDISVTNAYIGEAANGILFEQYTASTGKATFAGNTIRTTSTRGGSNAGLTLTGSSHCTATGNLVQGPWVYAIDANSAGCAIVGNTVVQETGGTVGIQVRAATQLVADNYLFGNGSGGGQQGLTLTTAGAVNSVIRGNLIEAFTYGIQFNQGSATATLVQDNTFANGNVAYNGSSAMAGIIIMDPALARITTGTGVIIPGQNIWQQYKATVTSTSCIANAVTCDITIATLPAKTILKGVYADLTTVFACASVCTTATLSGVLGRGSGGAEFLASFDLDAATAQFGDADAELGTQLVRAAAIQGGILGSWSSTTTVVLRITSGTGNLGTGAATNLSQGSVSFWLLTERLQ